MSYILSPGCLIKRYQAFRFTEFTYIYIPWALGVSSSAFKCRACPEYEL